MPQAACLTPLPLLSPLDCTVFCSKQFFTVWAAQVNLPAWLARGDAAHSRAALLQSFTCLWGGFLRVSIVPQQGMGGGVERKGWDSLGAGKGLLGRMGSGSILRDGCMVGYGVREHPWAVDW